MKARDLEESKKILYANWEKHRGKHVLVVGGKIFAARTGKKALTLLKRIEKENPSASPLLAYIPKEGTLILWL